jgi:hypothetical protein
VVYDNATYLLSINESRFNEATCIFKCLGYLVLVGLVRANLIAEINIVLDFSDEMSYTKPRIDLYPHKPQVRKWAHASIRKSPQ